MRAERAEWTGGARNSAGSVERHNLLTSGWFGLTDDLCIRRIARGAEQIGYAPILQLAKV
jgi:hypothetical protein